MNGWSIVRNIGLAVFLWPVYVTQGVAQVFTPNDIVIGSNFFQVEFSDDSRYMTWCEQIPSLPGRANVFATTLDLNTGYPDLQDKVLIDTISGQGWPYWGRDATSPFFLLMNRYDELKMVRVLGDTLVPTVIAGPSNHPRSLINVSSDSTLPYFWISYVVLSADFSAGYDSLFVLRSDNPADPVFVARERALESGSTYALTFPRWLKHSQLLALPFWPRAGVPLYDIRLWNGATLTSRVVTDDSDSPGENDASHIDDLPYTLPYAPGDTFLFSSRSATAVSIYRKTGSMPLFTEIERYAPISTTLTGGTLTSFEPFTLPGNRTYGAYQIYEGGGIPGNTTGEIWLKGIGGQASTHIRLSAFQGDVAVDPEYVIGTDSVWVYYYGKPVGVGPYNLHRCSTPLQVDVVTHLEPSAQTTQGSSVYPNPATDYIYLRVPEGQTGTFSITSAQGRVVLKGTLAPVARLDLSVFTPGVFYVTTVRSDGNNQTHVLVLQGD